MNRVVWLCKLVYQDRDGSQGVLWAPNMAGLAAAFRQLLVTRELVSFPTVVSQTRVAVPLEAQALAMFLTDQAANREEVARG